MLHSFDVTFLTPIFIAFEHQRQYAEGPPDFCCTLHRLHVGRSEPCNSRKHRRSVHKSRGLIAIIADYPFLLQRQDNEARRKIRHVPLSKSDTSRRSTRYHGDR